MEISRSFTKSSPGCLAFLTRSRGHSSKESARVQSPPVSRPTYAVDFANPGVCVCVCLGLCGCGCDVAV